MLDLGLDVLFKGKNMARLLGGLGVALKISVRCVAWRRELIPLYWAIVGRAMCGNYRT